MLTDAQVAFFRTFGFLMLPQAFSPDEMAVIDAEFEDVMAADRAGRSFRGDKRHWVLGCAELRPMMRSLIEDDRVYEPMDQLLGPELMWWGSGGNYYVGDTGWHPDTALSAGSPRSIKVALYLDPVTRETGCLRLIPGSHRPPLHDDLTVLRMQRTMQAVAEGRAGADALERLREEGVDVARPGFGVPPEDVPAYAAESRPGDVVMFDQSTYHASFGGKSGRRMLTLNYTAVPKTAEALAFLRQSYASNVTNIRRLGYSGRENSHDDDVLRSDRPRLQRIVAPLLELGFR